MLSRDTGNSLTRNELRGTNFCTKPDSLSIYERSVRLKVDSRHPPNRGEAGQIQKKSGNKIKVADAIGNSIFVDAAIVAHHATRKSRSRKRCQRRLPACEICDV